MKTALIIILILIGSSTFGQRLQRETLFGVHVITVDLRPNVTMDEFKNFFVSKVLPEYEKHWTGLQGYLVKSVRGENQNRFAVMWLFKTEAIRDSYFNADGTPNELEKAAFEKVKPIEEELKRKYGTYTIDYSDDWIVQ